MTKSKEEKPDGLEIISIGKIYCGPWGKKYWSSSRGKDRYPYPVGYKTLRTLNGVTYKMEILEGLKGPLFTIMSPDGNSYSAQTPDIAWESFQKKGCPRSKLLHGKRFTCKIDGVEFFGFKNAFVQRLLRELVANVSGTSEQRSSQSNLDIEAAVNEIECRESSKHLDMLPYLAKPRVTGKRSRKEKIINVKHLNEENFKHQPRNCMENDDTSNSRQRDRANCHGGNPRSTSAASSKVCSSINIPRVRKGPNLAAMVEKENDPLSAERGLQSDALNTSDHLQSVGLFHQEREHVSSENHFSTDADNLPKVEELPNWSRTSKVHLLNISIPEEKGGITLSQHNKPRVDVVDCCIPDTLDAARDSFSNSVPNERANVNVPCNAGEDTFVPAVAISEVLLTDSLLEDETCASIANSEKSDIDSLGQEIAKSMMSVLLPRALPLLKTFSRKKKKSMKSSESPLHRQEGNNTTIGFDDASIELSCKVAETDLNKNLDLEGEKEKGNITCPGYGSMVSSPRTTESVVPDSFDGNGSTHTSIDHHDMFPDTAKGHKDLFRLNNYDHQTMDQPVCVDAEAELPVQPTEARDQEINLQCELQMASYEHHQEETSGANLTGKTNSSIRSSAREISVFSKCAGVDCKSTIEMTTSDATQIRCAPLTEHTICRDFKNVCSTKKRQANFTRQFHSDTDADSNNSYSYLQIPTSCYANVTEDKEMKDALRLNFLGDLNFDDKPQGLLRRVASYNHPMPISMVLLNIKENEIYICALCGFLEQEITLFVYKAPKNGEKMGIPSSIGHASITLPFYKDALGRDIIVDSSRLQFTPDGQSLVLLNSIKTPYCRECKLNCSCPRCNSEFSEKNAVKIVQVQNGYVTIKTILRTAEDVCCLLVCEPSFLLAAEEGGKLNLWVMNSIWSAQKEESNLPTLDCMLPCIVELKRIPKSTVLVVGHNGFGEFGLWDIEKRILVSKFSAPRTSVFQCVPIGMFRWQSKGERNSKELIDEIMDVTKMWFSVIGRSQVLPMQNTDVGIWLLISTSSDPDSQGCQSSGKQQANQARCWKLTLLVKNMMIIGSALDSGAAAVTSVGHGIIGRCDGLVYIWELSTGIKLGNLHHFKGTKVSCVATDNTDSGAIAIASEGELLVYLQT